MHGSQLRPIVVAISFVSLAFCIADLSSAVVVDVFSTGQVVLTGPETVVQTGLDSNGVAGSVRKVTAVRSGDTVEVLAAGGLEYASNNGYGLGLEYGSEQVLGIDTVANELDRIVLRFSGSSQPAARQNSLYVNLPPTGSDNGLSFGDALFSLGEAGRIEFLLADVPTNTDQVDGIIVNFARAFGVGGFLLEEISLASTPLDGDYNRDGSIDGGDLQEWQRLFGGNSRNGSQAESYLTADGNYDGVVSGADFLIWQRTLRATMESTSIPEPATPLLAALGLLVVGSQRRRPSCICWVGLCR